MLTWEELRRGIGRRLTEDLFAIGFNPENMLARGNTADQGWRRYATWLLDNASGTSQALGVLNGTWNGKMEGARLTLLVGSVQAWIDQMSIENSLSTWTVRNYGLQTVRALIDLSELPHRTYPKVTRSMVKLPRATDTAKSLGELASIDTTGHEGKRESAARDIVLGIAEQEFNRLHNLFKIGRQILAEAAPAALSGSNRAQLADCLRFEERCWQTFGMSQFDQRAPALIEAAKLSHLILATDVMSQMSDVKFWIAGRALGGASIFGRRPIRSTLDARDDLSFGDRSLRSHREDRGDAQGLDRLHLRLEP